MAKILRKAMRLFGSTAGASQIGKFGSLAAGSPVATTGALADPDTIQALSNYDTGWNGAVIGGNSPAIEDMNGLCYLFAYQLAYGLQTGVPEWNAATTYYTGSLVNDGSGVLYSSLTDANINHAITDTTYWRPAVSPKAYVVAAPASPYTITAADTGKIFEVSTASAAYTFTLPAAALGLRFSIKDTGGNSGTNAITVVRAAAESIEGLAASYVCECNYGIWHFVCDGTNWYLN